MGKWGARAGLVLLAVIVLMTLPYHALSIAARGLIAGRPLKDDFMAFGRDIREVAGYFRANWRDDDGVDSGV